MLTAPAEIQTVYLSGPMSGIAQFNFPAFHSAAAELRQRGFDVVNPAEHDDPDGESQNYCVGSITKEKWAEYLARDVKMLLAGHVDAIAVLPGWRNSVGSQLEVCAGLLVGLPIINHETGLVMRLKLELVELKVAA